MKLSNAARSTAHATVETSAASRFAAIEWYSNAKTKRECD
nr:MAG TPA: hypothetical protein [Caudoviricetes sp.]